MGHKETSRESLGRWKIEPALWGPLPLSTTCSTLYVARTDIEFVRELPAGCAEVSGANWQRQCRRQTRSQEADTFFDLVTRRIPLVRARAAFAAASDLFR
jgi:hypothetical protein